jgi:hypothetical protein
VRGNRSGNTGDRRDRMNEFSEYLSRVMSERSVGVRELARKVPCNPGYLSNLRKGVSGRRGRLPHVLMTCLTLAVPLSSSQWPRTLAATAPECWTNRLPPGCMSCQLGSLKS